jgi:hypothetical protein
MHGEHEARRSTHRLTSRGASRIAVGVLALLVLLVESAIAGIPRSTRPLAQVDDAKQPRMLGKRAIMHVYYFVPKTLEITHVDSFFFKDADTCENSVDAALRVARPRARDGDLVDADCVSIDPPTAIAQPDTKPLPSGVTEL